MQILEVSQDQLAKRTLLTDVGGVIEVLTTSPMGSSDHRGLSCKIQLDFPLPDFTTSREVTIKSRINWMAFTVPSMVLFGVTFTMLFAPLLH